MSRVTERIGPLGFLLCCCWFADSLSLTSRGPRTPELNYRIRFEPEPSPGVFAVEVTARFLPKSAQDVTFHLNSWGGWLNLPTYLVDLEAKPPLQRSTPEERMRVDLSSGWQGSARLSYVIPLVEAGTPEHRGRELLPTKLQATASGIAENMLPRVLVDGASISARRNLELSAPDDYSIITGCGGHSRKRQVLLLDHDIEQCPIYFDPAPRIQRHGSGKRLVEVIQVGNTTDVTETLLQQSVPILAACEAATGHRLDRPSRVFVRGVDPSGGGGMGTYHGIELSFAADIDAPHRIHLLGHELFHQWLPGSLPAKGSTITWFFEGFTEYLSLFLVAQSEVFPRDEFAGKVLQLQAAAQSSSAFGKVSYSKAPLAWRDGDGPLETLAYNGGALLGFHLDAELARHGESLVELLGDWMQGEDPHYSLPRLRRSLAELDLDVFFERCIAAGQTPTDAREVLDRLGFFSDRQEVPATLTYFGIKTDAGMGPGEILGIDPEGPAASKGLHVGDRILDFGPRRPFPARLRDGVQYEYAFGLTLFSLVVGGSDWYVNVQRGQEVLRLTVEPWGQTDAGIEQRGFGDPKRMADFFELPRPLPE